MKRKVLFAFLFVTFVGLSQTDHDSKKTTFGFRAGLNLSDLTILSSYYNNEGDGTYATTTLYGIFYSNFRLNNRLSLQPELGFTYSEDLIFVEVPLFLNYDFSNKFTGFMGPKYSYLTNENYNNSLFTTRSSFSVDLGVRYKFISKFFIDATFSFPLTTQKQTYFNNFNTVRYSRNELRFGVGYRF